MVLAVESPLLFSFRAPASHAPAQPELALRLLAARQVDRMHLAVSLVRLASHRGPRREAGWLEVAGRQVVHALFRLARRQDPHQSEAWQVDRSRAVLALRHRGAQAHQGRLAAVVSRPAPFRNF